MGKSPAFQMYAADFEMDTASWTVGQVGAYLRLLFYEWVNGALPNKIGDLARIARVDPRNMQKMWSTEIAKKFITDDANMLINPRLELERQKQDNYRELQIIKGQKSGEIRRKKANRGLTGVEPKHEPKGNSSVFSLLSSDIKDTSVSLSPGVKPDDLNKTKPIICPQKKILAIYHETLPEMPVMRVWTEARSKNLTARWKEDKVRQDIEWWKNFFQEIRTMPFLMGNNNHSFRASLDWIVIADNFAKILNGKYKPREKIAVRDPEIEKLMETIKREREERERAELNATH